MRRRPRIALGLAGAAWVAFALLAWAVEAGHFAASDARLLGAFRNPLDPQDPLGPRWLERVAGDITSLGSFSVLALLVLVVSGFLWLSVKRHAALLVLLAAVSGSLASTALKGAFERPRPTLISHLAEVSSASFPSGHAMLSATIYLTLGVLFARVQRGRALRIYPIVAAAAIALLVGMSRLYLGVHWPTDVLAGWLAGTAWALLSYAVAASLQERGVVEGVPPGAPAEAAARPSR